LLNPKPNKGGGRRDSKGARVNIIFSSPRRPKKSKGDPYYALNKLEEAVHQLAVSLYPLRARLRDAFFIFNPVMARDLPAPLRADFVWIRNELTKKPSRIRAIIYNGHVVKGCTGALEATLPDLRNKKLVEIAKRICKLTDQLRVHLSKGVR